MGPITGIRIVNLRVRDKVAYPDVTLDIGGNRSDHLVIGLENGGGKSTLLGAVYHIFVPDADQFLPRRAQRRQGKEGDPKLLEHYVPGGDPTHFIVELETPERDGPTRRRLAERFVVGACLWKPPGAPESAPAKEFFWSARSVNDDLTLARLPVRRPGGGLLDHAEFRAKLKQLRGSIPAAQITDEDVKSAWQKHLRSVGIDVDFVQQFLLRMNEDEGAADRVFTYATPRAFLNSLVGVVGNSEASSLLKQGLADTARDAAALLIDRRRAGLLEQLVAHAGPLATATLSLREQSAIRDQWIRALVLEQAALTRALRTATSCASDAEAARAVLDRVVNDARNAYNDANARYVQSRVQVAELTLAATTTAIQEVESSRASARREERTAIAASLLARRRAAEARIREIDDALLAKASDAEPVRRSLSSALQSLEQRLRLETASLDAESAALAKKNVEATAAAAEATSIRSAAQLALGELVGEQKTLANERGGLARRLQTAVQDGLLPSVDADLRIAASAAKADMAAASARAGEQEHLRQLADKAIVVLHQRDRKLAAAAALAGAAVTSANEALERAQQTTESVRRALEVSGLVDAAHIQLDSHAPGFVGQLANAIDEARRTQAASAVHVAAANRAEAWLRDHERLPPRADVETLCDRLRTRKLGARPGWSYLGTLSADIAAQYAHAWPGLADGVVVNIPEDLREVLTTIETARGELVSPVVVGLAAAFEASSATSAVTVVLPHEAHWSSEAAREIIEVRTLETARWQSAYQAATARASLAETLRVRLENWLDEIGVGGLNARHADVERCRAELAGVTDAQLELKTELDARTVSRDVAEERRDDERKLELAATSRVRQLELLIDVKARLATIDARLDDIGITHTAETSRLTAAVQAEQHARAEIARSANRRAELAAIGGALARQRGELAGGIAVAVRPGDEIDGDDLVADRLLLEDRVLDRTNRWQGAVTDPQLRAQIESLRSDVKTLEKQLGAYTEVVVAARSRVDEATSLSSDDFLAAGDEARRRVESLGETLGELRIRGEQHEAALNQALEDFRTLRRPAELAVEERSSDLVDASRISDILRTRRDEAMAARNVREAEQSEAQATDKLMAARVGAFRSVAQRGTATLQRVARGGTFVPQAELSADESVLELDLVMLADPAYAGPRPELMRIVHRKASEITESLMAEDALLATAALDQTDADIDSLLSTLTKVEADVARWLDDTEALLRNADEELVKGDRLLQVFRASTRSRLLDLAVDHERDVVQRLLALRHHVENFDARLDALGDTVYATVADMLREVRQTVRDSQLPNTVAMGRWAGAELLRLTGHDSLRIEQRRAAIAALLREWFDPSRADIKTRRFDGDDITHDLLKAVTPQFTAGILVPSDPLDPQHKPVAHLARETSGGEGVTVALIIASLLASRRAALRGYHRTTLLLDNPFAKVTKPEFLRLARDVASELNVQLVLFTGIQDVGALSVFSRLTQLRVSRRTNANFVVPAGIDDDRLQGLIREGTLFVSPTEVAASRRDDAPETWPLMSSVSVAARPRSDDDPTR